MKTLRQQLLDAGVLESQLDNHCSDLYVLKTPISTEVLKSYEFPQNITTFIDNIEHKVWYEIPFAYTEDYDKKGSDKQ